MLIQARELNTRYKHQAFPYYNNEPDSSSNTGGHRNSKNSDPEAESKKRKEGRSFSEESLNKNIPEPKQNELELEIKEEHNLPEINT